MTQAEAQRKEALEKWKLLLPEERAKYGDKEGVFVIRTMAKPTHALKSLRQLEAEVEARLKARTILKLLSIDGSTAERESMELVESLENVDHIAELCRLRKKTLSAEGGPPAEERSRLRNCMRQGRELYLAGKLGGLLVKPLNFFYSVTAYSYASSVINNPIRKTIDSMPGSHGIVASIDEGTISFGGDVSTGAFTDLVGTASTLLTQSQSANIIQDNSASMLEFFARRHTVSPGLLLSLIPEVRQYYQMVSGRRSRAHPLIVRTNANDVGFTIGDGVSKPDKAAVEAAFPGLPILETGQRLMTSVPVATLHAIRACMFVGLDGGLWLIENPFHPVILSEICVHFALLHFLSCLMRYSPDDWGRMLLYDSDRAPALLVRRYLSMYEVKFPFLLLREMSGYYPYLSSAGLALG